MKRPLLPVLLILFGALLLLVALAAIFWQAGVSGSIPTPPRLAGLAHTRLVSGEAASREIQQLHGREFSFNNASIAEYGNGRLTLWVAELAGADQVVEMIQSMGKRIAQGSSPFTPVTEQQLQGAGGQAPRMLYALEGMGQGHVYFQSGRRVIWLAADADLLEAALDECLAFFP